MNTFVFYYRKNRRTVIVAAVSEERAIKVFAERNWDWLSEIAAKSEEEGILFDSNEVSV